MLQHPNTQTTKQVNHKDQNTRHGISANELRATIHRTIEVSLLGYLSTTIPRLILIDEPGVEISINRHLFTWHRIKRKAGAYFGDSTRSLSNNHKVNDYQNQKDDDT